MRRSRHCVLLALLTFAPACSRQSGEPDEPPAPPPAQDPFTPYHDWKLTEFGDRSDVPDGKNGKVLTLSFDSAGHKVSGFSGCNTYTGSFTVDGKKLTLGALAGTKMACPQGMELEAAFLAALGSTNRYTLIGAELQLLGQSHATEMRFRPIELKPP